MSKHTPAPWSVGNTREHSRSTEVAIHVGSHDVYGLRGNCLAIVYLGARGAVSSETADVEANAEFIVRAVNAHDALVSALEANLKFPGGIVERRQAEDALKLAKGE